MSTQVKDTITKRIDAVTNIPEKYRGTVLPAPPSVKVELTSRCNFGCHFCAHKLGGKKFGDMDFDLFKKIAKEMREAGVEELGMFYIGESFLVNWLPEAIRYAKEELKYPYVFLTTNGSIATPDRVEKVMSAGLDSLKWSFNHADEWQFREITTMAPHMFSNVIHNIKEAFRIRNEKGFKTKLYASSIKYQDEQLEKMEKAVEEIIDFVDEHYWLPLLSFGDQNSMDEEPVVGNPGRLETMRAPVPCWAVFREGHVTHTGLLSACCFDNSDKWVMADLKETSFMDAWNSVEYQELRRRHLNGDVHGTPCETCIHGDK
jgi:MoaA/NifB/PqqE/SkfB family radical SAM enzyme